MKESGITSRLVKEIPNVLPGAVVFKHFDVSTDGIPDLSITWGRNTIWIEVKFMSGETRATQVVTMKRLGQMGKAWYVRFTIIDSEKLTFIYSPDTIWDEAENIVVYGPVFRRLGWDTAWVAMFIRKELRPV